VLRLSSVIATRHMVLAMTDDKSNMVNEIQLHLKKFTSALKLTTGLEEQIF
jgi:hypothetical protein